MKARVLRPTSSLSSGLKPCCAEHSQAQRTAASDFTVVFGPALVLACSVLLWWGAQPARTLTVRGFVSLGLKRQ